MLLGSVSCKFISACKCFTTHSARVDKSGEMLVLNVWFNVIHLVLLSTHLAKYCMQYEII